MSERASAKLSYRRDRPSVESRRCLSANREIHTINVARGSGLGDTPCVRRCRRLSRFRASLVDFFVSVLMGTMTAYVPSR